MCVCAFVAWRVLSTRKLSFLCSECQVCGSLCCLAVLVDVRCVFAVCALHFKFTFLLVLLVYAVLCPEFRACGFSCAC